MAGLALLIGVAVASFYMDPWPGSSLGLVAGVVCLVVAGLLLLDRKGPFDGRERVRQRLLRGGGLLSAVLLFGYLDQTRLTWTVGFVMLFIVALSLPFATASLDRARHATPALPAMLVLVELLLLLLFGAVNAPASGRFALYQEFAIVALPTAGGLIGCLLYLARMPWRAEAAVRIGTGGQLALGLLVAWGTLRLGAITAEVQGGTSALLWLVCVPTFECIRSQLGVQAGRLGTARWFEPPKRRWLGRVLVSIPVSGYAPVALVGINLLAGLIGVSMCVLGVSGYCMTLALGLFFFVYLAVPATLAAWSAAGGPARPLRVAGGDPGT